MATAHLAIDLGASSGRVIVGRLDGTVAGLASSDDPSVTSHRKNPKLLLEELHRFEHLPCPTPFGPVWDLTGIWLNILTGLRQASRWCREHQVPLHSIGVDTWGVDWCLVGKTGELLMLPHCYRDPQNEPASKWVLDQVGGKEALYQRNGIQLMSLNTIFQVAARCGKEPKLFHAADKLLFVPDLFHYWLSGQQRVERTIASTSALLGLQTGDWDRELLSILKIPGHLFGPMIEPGSEVGTLREEIAAATELNSAIKIISPGAHDTAAAIAAVPATNGLTKWAYLSSGTWSLLGVELDKPFANSDSCAVPFTNERGVNQSIRFLKNIAGLWLIQELKREWDQLGQAISFAEMVAQARLSEPFRTLVDPNDSRFAIPGEMAQKVQQFARETNQPIPQSVGELVRCCLESLAFSYRDTVDQLERILQIGIERLHVVGGGTQNDLLNEMTAATLQRPVICGPVEATAVGNLLIQAMGCGAIADLASLRQIVEDSFELQCFYPPTKLPILSQQFLRFRQLIR